MTENELLERFYEYYDARDYPAAEKLIRRIIKNGDTSAWAYSKLSSTLYEQRKYGWALKYAQKAYSLDSKNTIILWDLAGALAAKQFLSEAIDIWMKIISYGPEEAGQINTQMGLSWGRLIINDSKYRISKAYYQLYQDKEAEKYLKEYLENRKYSRNSLYGRKDALKLLKKIEKGG